MYKFASIILDTNVEKPLDYAIPTEMQKSIKKGMRVEVPVRNSKQKGYVFSLKKDSSFSFCKEITAILSQEVLSDDLMQLALFMAKYYATNLSKVLKSMVPSSIRKEIKPQQRVLLQLAKTKKEAMQSLQILEKKHPQQAYVLQCVMQAKKGILLSELIKMLNISKSPISSLVKKGLIREKKITDSNGFCLEQEFFSTQPKTLIEEQKNALLAIQKSLQNDNFATHLLFGVTGSGKTEVYLQAIQEALDRGKSVIMLVPEISLTSQTIERFRARFDEKIAVLHHRRSQGERYEAWHQIKNEKARIVIGARSAVFAPVKNLGLIIVDEEHDSSYKQTEEAPTYHARNIAVKRGQICNCPVVLGSATPAVESYYNALKNKYQMSILKTRPTKASLPSVSIIDMKRERERQGGFTHFSEKLLNGIKKRYEKGEQILLFLNRRGFHTYLICSSCSHIEKCPHCDITLTYHKGQSLLLCHSCGFHQRPKRSCPACNADDAIEYRGYGTEHVERCIKAIFPDIRTLRVDRDTTKEKNSHEELFKQFRSGKADILIGTQMIVKGLHFPSLTLVGVLNSDAALNIPDFRSSERVFQLLCQVAGRAGRDHLPGEVIIQTFLPENSTLKLAAKQDYETFYHAEIEERELFQYPPFTHMIKLMFSGKEEKKVKEEAVSFRKKLIDLLPNTVTIHPVLPPGQPKSNDLYRFSFLIRAKSPLSINESIEKIKKTVPSSISLFIDVDPISTFF